MGTPIMSSLSPTYKNQTQIFASCINYSQLLDINGINFTRREIDVIACILNGRSTKLAATLLTVSHKTIDAHIRNILLKLKAQTQRRIVEFIESSDKYLYLKEHYTKLLIHAKFELILKNLQNSCDEPVSLCIVTNEGLRDQQSEFVKQLSFHFKLAGINVSSTPIRNIKTHVIHCAFTNDTQSYSVTKTLEQCAYPIIFLTLGEPITNSDKKPPLNSIYVKLLDQEHYYSLVFLLLAKILPSESMTKNVEVFNAQYCMLNNNNIVPSRSEENANRTSEHSEKRIFHVKKINLFSQKLTLSIAAVCVFLVIIFCTSIYITNINSANSKEIAKEIAIPNINPISVQIEAGGSVTWNLPRQDHKFIGREALLEELKKQLHNQNFDAGKNVNTSSFNVAVCAGLGGIGKTQLALQYIHNSKHFYKLKAWFAAENINQLKQEYIDFAWALGYRDRGPSFENAFIYIKEWLSKNPEWLLVYDSVNSYEEIKDFLPAMSGGNVILTTRQQNWPNTFKKLNIELMTEKESMDLIQSIVSQKTQPDEETVKHLVRTLGYLPLALSQAGAYIRQTSISFADYSKLYDEHAQEFLSDKALPEGTNSRPIATTWNISLEAIAREDVTKYNNPLALHLLGACAYLAPSKIPYQLLLNWLKVSYPKMTKHEIILAKLIGQLGKYSMISKDEEGNIIIHRLVQAVVRSQQTMALGRKNYYPTLTKKTFNILLQSIHNEFTKNEHILENERRQKALLPHMQSLLAHYDKIWPNAADVIIEPLLNDIGSVFGLIGDWHIGKHYHERALELMEKHYSKRSIKVTNSLDLLGNAARHSGDIKKAQFFHQLSLAIKEKYYGQDHIKVAFSLDYLGRDYRSLGDFKQAKELHERSLIVKERYYGKDHVEVSHTLDQLGRDYRNLWDVKQAKKIHERSLKIKEINYGKGHVEVAYTLDQLGSEYRYLGDAKQAKELHERSFLIKEKYYGKDHVKVAHTMDQLGMDFMYLHEIKRAKLLHESSLKIKEKHYGSNHIELSSTLEHLGKENAYLGNIQQSKILHERALLIKTQHHGSNHPEIAESYTNLAAIYIKLHNLPQAKTYLDQALAITEHYHGVDNIALVEILIEFGNYYKYLNDTKRAQEYLAKALKIRQEYFGKDNPLTLVLKQSLLSHNTSEPKG